MFKDDIDLVREMAGKYGLPEPVADLGGLTKPTIADYTITIATGNQHARYITLDHRPFDDVAFGYTILNPEQGDPFIEDLPAHYPAYFGTIICLSVLEHVENPFKVFDAFAKLLKPQGLLIVSTVFSFPSHPSPEDNWRFSPNALKILADSARLNILECGWRLKIHGGMGVKEIHTGVPQEIVSVYVVARND